MTTTNDGMDERLASLAASFTDEVNWRANGAPKLLASILDRAAVAITLERHHVTVFIDSDTNNDGARRLVLAHQARRGRTSIPRQRGEARAVGDVPR